MIYNGPSVAVSVSCNRKVRLTCTNSIGCLLGHGVAGRPAHRAHPQSAAGKHQTWIPGTLRQALTSSTQYQELQWEMSILSELKLLNRMMLIAVSFI